MIDILKPIVRHVTNPLFLRRDGIRWRKTLRNLNNSQWHSTESIIKKQRISLSRLLQYVYRHNAFYRRRFDEVGFHPDHFSDLADLKNIPILTKDEIREAGDTMFSSGYNKENTVHTRTGGSTGVPIHLYVDKSAHSFKVAATLRHNSWAGLFPGEPVAAIWGDTEKQVSLRGTIRNLLSTRTFYLDTLKFDEGRIRNFIKTIRSRSPTILIGHAHSVFKFSQYLDQCAINDIRFRGVITTAMSLSPAERVLIESSLSSPVFDRYGCEEISIIASESEHHSGMHILAEGIYIEPLSKENTRPGEIIITDLQNKAMPLIRYQIGDYGRFESGPCPSGRGLPRLAEVIGRSADFLYKPDGTPVMGISILDTFIIHIAGIKQAQLIQDKYDHVKILLVKDLAFEMNTLEKLQATMITVFGSRMKYSIQYVNSIPLTRSGKYRFSICQLPDKS